jgi:hypothetical protein
MLWGELELESREVTLGEIPLGSNHAERVFYNLLEFSTAYVWSKAILEKGIRTEVLGHTPGRMGNNAC